MLDHVSISVRDLARARAFYEKALRPLGITCLYAADPAAAGYGSDGRAYFWINRHEAAVGGMHIAFASPDRPTVDAFYKAALAAGGTDNGPPGVRPHYHPNYYGAFVLDPDGHNIEAVCRLPPG